MNNLAGVFGSERLLQQVVDQILEQTRLPEDSMEEDRTDGSDGEAGGGGRCRSPHGPLTSPSSSSTTASKFIIKGYKTLHKEELGVSETERRLLERIQTNATTSRRKHESGSPERDRHSTVSGASAMSPITVVSNTSLPLAQPASVERPNFVRVVTSDGRQGQLRPSALGVTFTELQAWVTTEFGIPAERQLLKSGIPPRVLVAPPNGGALSLSHGDRVIVEVVGADPSAGAVAHGGPLDAASTSDDTLEGDLVRHLHEVQKILSLESGLRAMLGHLKRTGASVWSYAQENEWLFCRGGLFYAQMQRDVGLVDGKHCHLPLIPDKVFTYNAKHDRLELCFEPYGHFAIGPDVEAKIASGQVGSTGQHHQSPTASPTSAAASSTVTEGASTSADSSNTGSGFADEKKSASVVAKASRTVVRKGPGFTVLAPASPEKPGRLTESGSGQCEQKSALEQLQTVVSMLQDQGSRLQEKLAKGELKPGLYAIAPHVKKEFINNTAALKQKLAEMELDLDWVETLTMVNGLAPLTPELSEQFGDMELQKNRKGGLVRGATEDAVHHDFKREMAFYRQAQAAVLEGIPRLHQLGVVTKRPEDYFAQMAKADTHMTKVREKLLSKKVALERSEKARKMRELKKFGKKVQVEVLQQRQKEKREMMENLKKFKKGHGSLDFLENSGRQKGQKPGPSGNQPGRGKGPSK
ncbi:hypothetical protein HPB49_007759 [Dermacentor silvarum]|uniref:Uncharacterized protein n=1 Tax=Dermacentor silvarum TaxID=543639 RepID=A0ACB8DIE1_DERSI|nr:hypothetical protein HPB49_007759 [Dermacentor silvarum]